jgi:hypothetical protein
MSALGAPTQMHPTATGFEALDASVPAGLGRDNDIEVSASIWHAIPP